MAPPLNQLQLPFSDPRLRGNLSLAVETLAFNNNPAAGRALVEIAKIKDPAGKEALRWLLHLAETRWKDFDLLPLLEEHGLIPQEN